MELVNSSSSLNYSFNEQCVRYQDRWINERHLCNWRNKSLDFINSGDYFHADLPHQKSDSKVAPILPKSNGRMGSKRIENYSGLDIDGSIPIYRCFTHIFFYLRVKINQHFWFLTSTFQKSQFFFNIFGFPMSKIGNFFSFWSKFQRKRPILVEILDFWSKFFNFYSWNPSEIHLIQFIITNNY